MSFLLSFIIPHFKIVRENIEREQKHQIIYNVRKGLSSIKDLSTSVYENIILTNLTGHITTADVNVWFNSFEKKCQLFISQGKKYKLFVNRKGYTPEHFSVQKQWKDKFFSENILENTMAIAFLMEEGDILNHLKDSNTKSNVVFSSNYEQLIDWLSTYK